MENYIIKNISHSTIDLFKSCFDQNGSPKSKDKIVWQFLGNPIEDKFVDIAYDNENHKVAAIYAIFPVKFKINESIVLASQSLDTITDIDYRGKGLFIRLAMSVYEKAKNKDIKLVYGFPNGNSIHGFKKKLDWQVLDPVPFLIKPLKTKYFSTKIKAISWFPNVNIGFKKTISNNVIIKEENTFSDEVNIIWKKFSQSLKIGINRDKEYLNWRYIQKPNEDYKILHAYNNSGGYIGFIVYCVKGKHGGKIGYIMEYLYDPDYKIEAENLMKEAVNRIISTNADCILAWCMEHSDNYKTYRNVGFYEMPKKLRPIELHFGVCSFDNSLNTIINNRKNWYLSYSDSDTV
ncbi:GNAT family N-acetyltransferase [Soonwooa purpurea]